MFLFELWFVHIYAQEWCCWIIWQLLLQKDSYLLSLPILHLHSQNTAFLSSQFIFRYLNPRASLVTQSVNNLPAMRETWIHSQGLKDPPRPSFPHSQSFPSGSFYNPLIHQRADRLKTTITEN